MAEVPDEMAASPGDAHPETETLNPRARSDSRPLRVGGVRSRGVTPEEG